MYIALVAAVLFSLVHILTPRFSLVLSRNVAVAGSFGGGIASAFVFLELLPELDHGHQLIGEAIEFVILGGFIAVLGLNHLSEHRFKHKTKFVSIPIFIACAYNWLLIFAFPRSGNVYDLVICVLLVLHLAFYDHSLRKESPAKFDAWGRWLLVLSSLLGWFALVTIGHSGPFVEDLLIGLLSGAIIYQIFTFDLPATKETRFFWFLGGVLLYLGLYVVSMYMEMNDAAA